MIDKLEQIKLEINNVNKWNLSILKDKIENFIIWNIKLEEKKEKYLNNLKVINFQWIWTQDKSKQIESSNRALVKWKQQLNNLLINLNNFIESEINIPEEKEYNWNIHINIAENNWSQNINNQIDEIINILDKKDIQEKEEIKVLLKEYIKTGNNDSLIKGFSILGSISSAWSLVAGILSLLR